MRSESGNLLNGLASALGIAVCLFLSVFALDAIGTGQPWLTQAGNVAMHLVPVVVLGTIVALSWRREWLGAVVFTGLAVWFAWTARAHLSWVLTVSGPLLTVGLVFFWSWQHRRRLHA
jgi:hypothetical protein